MNADVWSRLELRHLATLRAVANTGSFAAAACELGYTQSAVSQQIATLERIIGAPVVDRPGGRRPAVLTEVGRTLLGHADAIVARLEAARADVAALVAGEAGTLRVGTYQSIGMRILPLLLREFRLAWPAVDIRLHEAAGDAELLERVRDGRLDLTFVTLPPLRPPLAGIELLRDPYVLVVAGDSPLTSRDRPLALRELAGVPLIAFRSCSHQPLIDAQLRASGIEPEVVFTSDDNGTVQNLVAAGMGVALVPRLTIDPASEATTVIELAGRLPPRTLGLVWHGDRYQTPAAAAFVTAAQSTFATFCARDGAAATPSRPRRRARTPRA
jgi:molybdate transport repressor ModE-like protein